MRTASVPSAGRELPLRVRYETFELDWSTTEAPSPLISGRESAAAFAKDQELGLGLSEFFSPHVDLLQGHNGGANKADIMERICMLAGYTDTSDRSRVPLVISFANYDDELRFRLLRTVGSGQ